MPKTAARPAPAPLVRRLGRPIWDGAVSFGLVPIPIKLYAGLRGRDLQFRLIHQKDRSRLKERFLCRAEQKEAPREEIVKAYERPRRPPVVVEPQELEALAPKASRTIEVQAFVRPEEIDPRYFERPYYLLAASGPRGQGLPDPHRGDARHG